MPIRKKVKQPKEPGNVEPLVIAFGSARPALVAQLINAGAEIPFDVSIVMKMMCSSLKTITGEYHKKVMEDGLNALQELVFGTGDSLFHNPNYIKARRAKRRGNYTIMEN